MANPSGSQPTTGQVSVITVQKIPFWPSNPTAWFKVLDNQFTSARITDELTKFNHVMSMLDIATIEKCMDIIEGIPNATAYTQFRTEAINRFSESENSRLQKVLSGTDLGDRKPSQLLHEMRSLAGTAFPEEPLKTLWLKRLPNQVRAILAASSEELGALSVLADKIVETLSGNGICSIGSGSSSEYSHSQSSSPNLSVLEQQISNLSDKLNRLEAFGYQSQSSRGRERSRQNNFRGRSRTRSPGKFCFYHERYGSKARNCRSPCSFRGISQPNKSSGNDTADRK